MRSKRNTSPGSLVGTGSKRQVVDSCGCINGQISAREYKDVLNVISKGYNFFIKEIRGILLLRCGGMERSIEL